MNRNLGAPIKAERIVPNKPMKEREHIEMSHSKNRNRKVPRYLENTFRSKASLSNRVARGAFINRSIMEEAVWELVKMGSVYQPDDVILSQYDVIAYEDK